MEVGDLEAAAEAKAVKHISNMLQRPDQLEKKNSASARVRSLLHSPQMYGIKREVDVDEGDDIGGSDDGRRKAAPVRRRATSESAADCWSTNFWPERPDRKSAFTPYKSTTVLTNLQRGNVPTTQTICELPDVSLHQRAGQGELSQADIVNSEKIDERDDRGLSALMWAASYGQVPTVQLLLKNGARAGVKGKEGETALMLAASGGHHDVARVLIAAGADVDDRDDNSCTALMFACISNQPHAVGELLLQGSDLTVKNINGDTAYSLSVAHGSKLAQTVIEHHLLSLIENRLNSSS